LGRPNRKSEELFKTLGVDLVEGFAVSDNIYHIDQLDPIIEKHWISYLKL